MRLLPERADKALDRLAGPLELGRAEIAQAMVDISVAHVSRSVELVSVQRGHDPKAYVIYGYGGMGPAVSALVASELGNRRVVIPPHPGLFSALGLLVADLKRVYRETDFLFVTAEAPYRITAAFERLQEEALREFRTYGCDPAEIEWERYVEMRYRGQGFELLAPIDSDRLRVQGHRYLLELFKETHRSRYGTAAPNDHIEVVTNRLVAKVPGSRDVLDRLHARAADVSSSRIEEGSVLYRGKSRSCRFVWRDSLSVGDRVRGLAIIEEPTATTLVPDRWCATVANVGALVLEEL